MDIGPSELIVILLIVLLLFGVGRITKLAGELGSGIRAFRDGLQGTVRDPSSTPETDKVEQAGEKRGKSLRLASDKEPFRHGFGCYLPFATSSRHQAYSAS